MYVFKSMQTRTSVGRVHVSVPSRLFVPRCSKALYIEVRSRLQKLQKLFSCLSLPAARNSGLASAASPAPPFINRKQTKDLKFGEGKDAGNAIS